MSKNTAISTTMTPPPTKAEIVEALAQRKLQQLKDQMDAQEAAIKSAWDCFLNAAVKQLRETPVPKIVPSDIVYDCTGYRGEEKLSEVGFCLRRYFVANDETTKLHAKCVALKNAEGRITLLPDIREIRAQIREALRGDSANRVNALLADADTRKAIDKTLANLDAGAGMRGQPLLAAGEGER